MYGKKSQTEVGAWMVLIFWPNFRLAVLIAVVLIKKKRVYDEIVGLRFSKVVYDSRLNHQSSAIVVWRKSGQTRYTLFL